MKKIFAILMFCFLSVDPSFSARLNHPNFYKTDSVWRSTTGEKFRLCRISSNGAATIVKKKRIKIFFGEDRYRLTRNSKRKLKTFFKKLPKHTFKIKITAHADMCGDHDYNQELARKRGFGVYSFVKNLIPEGVPVSGKNNGENHSSGHVNHDKFVEIVAEYWNPKERISQVVLFDISGSLHKRKIGHTVTGFTLEGLQQLKLKKGTIAYVPRDIRYSCQGQSLRSYRPIGEDYYWEAMTLISNSIIGKTKGYTFTDDTDPRGQKKERIFNRKNTGKIRWFIQ